MDNLNIKFIKIDLAHALTNIREALQKIEAGEYRNAAQVLNFALTGLYDAAIEKNALSTKTVQGLNFKQISRDALKQAIKNEKKGN